MHFDFSVYIVNFVIKMQMARSEQALKKKQRYYQTKNHKIMQKNYK